MNRWERIAQKVDAETAPVHQFTKGQIAQRLNMSRPALNRRLTGKVEWHYSELETLAGLFGVTVDELISEQEGGDAA